MTEVGDPDPGRVAEEHHDERDLDQRLEALGSGDRVDEAQQRDDRAEGDEHDRGRHVRPLEARGDEAPHEDRGGDHEDRRRHVHIRLLSSGGLSSRSRAAGRCGAAASSDGIGELRVPATAG